MFVLMYDTYLRSGSSVGVPLRFPAVPPPSFLPSDDVAASPVGQRERPPLPENVSRLDIVRRGSSPELEKVQNLCTLAKVHNLCTLVKVQVTQ